MDQKELTTASPSSQELTPAKLLEIANANMPFGKYKDRLLVNLPEPYLLWFAQRGFPNGKLGEQLQWMLEIKINGLEYLLKPLQRGHQTEQYPTTKLKQKKFTF